MSHLGVANPVTIGHREGAYGAEASEREELIVQSPSTGKIMGCKLVELAGFFCGFTSPGIFRGMFDNRTPSMMKIRVSPTHL
jgi:hypothetical protein